MQVWEGEKALVAAVDQLNGYMVFRDTKAAIILFIKRKDLTAAIEKASGAVRSHPQYKRDGRASSDPHTVSHFVMRHADDDLREVRLALIPVVIRPETPAE